MTIDKLRLLIVDDEENILSSLKRIFRTEPFETHFAGSAKEALEIMGQTDIQVLLTDNKMPNITGLQLVKEVKGRYPDCIRMVFSGESDMDSVVRAVNEGEVYRFIVKPWNDAELKTSVNLALAHWKLNHDLNALRVESNKARKLLSYILKNYPKIWDEAQEAITHDPQAEQQQTLIGG